MKIVRNGRELWYAIVVATKAHRDSGQHRVDVDDGATRVAVGGVTSVTAISAIYAAHICITASSTRLDHQLLVIPLAHLHTSCPH